MRTTTYVFYLDTHSYLELWTSMERSKNILRFRGRLVLRNEAIHNHGDNGLL